MYLDSRKRPHIDEEDDTPSNKKRATASSNGTPQSNGVADDEPSLDNLEVIRDPFFHILCAGSKHILPALQERGNIQANAPLFTRERAESGSYSRARASQKYMRGRLRRHRRVLVPGRPYSFSCNSYHLIRRLHS